ncbi:hypothetical protein LTR17_023201 [Elasticomyces elasticus]|nr:hypothetical protein LTR17_023201 [Elasticomyces elasticus]
MAGFPDDKEKAVIAGGELDNDSTTSITALVFEDHQHGMSMFRSFTSVFHSRGSANIRNIVVHIRM